jgi:hypothetical protein
MLRSKCCFNQNVFNLHSDVFSTVRVVELHETSPGNCLAGHMIRIAIHSSPTQDEKTVGQFVFSIHDYDHGELGPFEITK